MAITTTLTFANGYAVAFQSWNGYITTQRQVADVYHRLGQSGSGVQNIGYRAAVTQATAVALYGTAASAVTIADALMDAAGEIVTVLDGFGYYNRCLVHDVSAQVFAGKHGYGGASYPYRVDLQISLEYLGAMSSVAP